MKKSFKKKGISLAEILITLSILAIIIVPISNMALTSVKVERESEYKLKANSLAQLVLEKLKSNKNINLGFEQEFSINSEFCEEDENQLDFKLYKTNFDGMEFYIKVKEGQVHNPQRVTISEKNTSSFEKPKDKYGNDREFDAAFHIKIDKDDENKHIKLFFNEKKIVLNGNDIINIINENSYIRCKINDVYFNDIVKINSNESFTKIEICNDSPKLAIKLENNNEDYFKAYIEKSVSTQNISNYKPNYDILTEGKVIINSKVIEEDEQNSLFLGDSTKKSFSIKVYRYNKLADKKPLLLQEVNGYFE